MNIFSLENIRTWFSKSVVNHRSEFKGQGDVYVTHVVECLNYCRNNPNSSKCEKLFIQS